MQERMLASRRLTAALNAAGRGNEREAVLQQELALVERARAEAQARWEAARPQREAEERARWAQADAAARRQLTAEAIPDRELITRAIMMEFQDVGQNMMSLTFARALSSLTTRPGERSGFNEYWNHEHGSATLSFGQGEFAMVQSYGFSVRDVACRPAAAQRSAHDCTMNVQTSLNVVFAGAEVIDYRSSEVRLTTPIVWNGTRWSAPRVRAAMVAGLNQSAIRPAPRSNADPNNALCSSLYAGVVAAGGTSTSSALNPQTWGC
jgi:hypothetical protein